MPVVIQPRFPVMVLPRQPDRLVQALRVVLLQHIAPGVQLRGPGHLAGLVRQGHWRSQWVAVVVGWRCAVAAPVPAVLPACRSVGVWPPRPVRLGSPGRWAAGCAHGAEHKIAHLAHSNWFIFYFKYDKNHRRNDASKKTKYQIIKIEKINCQG